MAAEVKQAEVKLPEAAIKEMLKNKHKSFALPFLPSELKSPPPNLTCINCPKATWFATTKDVKGFCGLMHTVIHSSKDPGQILICDGNRPEEAPAEIPQMPVDDTEPDFDPYITDEIDKLTT